MGLGGVLPRMVTVACLPAGSTRAHSFALAVSGGDPLAVQLESRL